MKSERWLRWLALAIGFAYAALFVFVAIRRILYPYEVEWNEGAILDHAIRVMHGESLYTAPSLTFAPFVYTPIYYWITAIVMKIAGVGLWSGRLISVAATFTTAYLVATIVYRETATKHLALIAALLYLAFYHATGFFYDIVRMDALALSFGIAAVYCALYIRRGEILAAVCIALAYFTKQQMIAFWPPLAAWFIFYDRKRALSFILSSGLLVALIHFTLIWTTNDWYRFYTITIPGIKARKLFSWNDAFQFIPHDLFGTFAVFTIAIAAFFLLLRTKRQAQGNDRIIGLGFCYILSIASGALSLGNSGGYVNVLMPMAAMSAVLFPIAARAIGEGVLHRPAVIHWLSIAAFVSLIYNPFEVTMLVPSDEDKQAGDAVVASLASMAGDIWIPFHGYLPALANKPMHIHFMAMNDALIPDDTTSHRFQHEIDSAFTEHKFTAIIVDDDSVYKWRSIAHYQNIGRLIEPAGVFVSRIGDAPTRPQFIYRPTP